MDIRPAENPEHAQLWIDYLEQNKDRKGWHCLRGKFTNKMCCLGALAEMRGDFESGVCNPSSCFPKYAWDDKRANGVAPYASLSVRDQRLLAGLNDKSNSFEPIIEWIKENYIQSRQ